MYYFKQKWAENGDVTQIPLEAQTDNTVSYEEGWTEEYELNPEEDVNAQILSRTNFNGLFSNITTVLQQFQQYGINPFITSSDNGGTAFPYPLGGMCSYTDTTTNEYGIYYSLSANNTDAPSTGGVVSANWWRIDKTPADIAAIQEKLWTRNIGEIVTSTIPLSDSSLHMLDGSLLSGSGIYADFVSYIADLYEDNSSASYFTTEANWQASVASYGACGKFVYNSVAQTVRLPKILGFIEGGTTSNVGEIIAAGLPNITGDVGGYGIATKAPSGCFTGQYGSAGFGGSAVSVVTSTLDASLSSSVYGNSNTVQPQAIQVLYYIVVGRSSTATEIQVDINQITTDLAGKADTDLSNSTVPHIIQTYVNGKSWYRVYSDGWCEQGGYNAGTSGTYPDGETVTFLKPFANNNYSLLISFESAYTGSAAVCYLSINSKSATSFTISNGGGNYPKYWYACGYIN